MSVRLLSELSDLEKLTLTTMSYSRISTYDFCQAQYFYQYIVQEDRGAGEAALLGNVVHSTLEEQLISNEEIKEEALIKEFEEQLEAWDTDGIITDKFHEIGITILHDFIDRHTGETFPILSKEMSFEIVVGSALIRGFIDRVDLVGDQIRFVDYKTGAREVPEKDIGKNLQLGVYALALSKKYPDKEIYGELYYLRSGRQKGHLFSADDLSIIEKRLINTVYSLISTNDYTTTANSRACSFCDYAVSGRCPVGYRRILHRR